MSDRQAKAAAKRQRRAARPQGGSGPKQPEPSRREHVNHVHSVAGMRAAYADLAAPTQADVLRAANRAAFALGALCTGALSAPPKPSPPPGKGRR